MAGKLLRMKKSEWKEAARLARVQVRGQAADIADLNRQLEDMRKHWRPVPITHRWQPRSPQCALCDESRDSLRHT
jgi:hypothetical protein